MSRAVRPTRFWKRAGRALPAVLLLGLGLVTASGVLAAPAAYAWYQFPVLLLLFGVLLGTAVGRWRRGRDVSTARDVEFAAALLIGSYTLLSMTGGYDSSLYPVVYLTLAALVRFHRSPVAAAAGGVAIVLELASFALTADHWSRWDDLVAHLVFLAVFSSLNAVLRRLGTVAAHRRERQAAHAELRSAHDRARDYGLLAGQQLRRQRQQESEAEALAAFAAADQAVEATRRHLLEILRLATGARTVVLLWLDPEGQRFRVHEVSSADGAPEPQDAQAGAGVLGSLLKGGGSVILQDLRADFRGVSYYEDGGRVTAFLGAAVTHGAQTVGALCLDRADTKPFDERVRPLIEAAAAQCLRMVDDERALLMLAAEKEERSKFYEGSERLITALTTDDVHARTWESIQDIAAPDLMVLTEVEERPVRGSATPERWHRVTFARGVGAEDLVDLEFPDGGAVGLVCKRSVPFHKSLAEMRSRGAPTAVFGDRAPNKGIDSLLILPLVGQQRNRVAGTLILGDRERDAFPVEGGLIANLTVIANQVAVSLLNAKLFADMERMATTDGLTGLLNHRTFQERLQEFVERAARHGQVFSVILTDIDHFKRVNDTHGHPIGDKVLRRFSEVLASSARKIDLVARYGGEEFVLVLDGTDTSGAVQFAERMREEVARQVFAGAGSQTFSVTVSLGVSTYPTDGTDKAALVDHADQALYHSKEHGRNQTTTWQQLRGGSATAV